jgi:hypothetical protein
MFGHGQIEGHEERYGMEFRRALRDEPVDEGLEREHWRRIVPLLHRRALFAGAREFVLYDCRDHAGHVNEDVFAYSNRSEAGSALVLYHNRYAEARGTIQLSAAYAEKRADGSRPLRQRTLLDGLGFAGAADDALLRCRDQVSGQEFLFRARELRAHGLRVELPGYGSRVFLDWREAPRDARPWDELARTLAGGGVADLERELWRLAIIPVGRLLARALASDALAAEADPLLGPILAECSRLLTLPRAPAAAAAERLRDRLGAWTELERAAAPARPGVREEQELVATAWLLLECLGAAYEPEVPAEMGVRLFDALGLRAIVAEAARARGADSEHGWQLAARVRALLAHPRALADASAWAALVADPDAAWAAGFEPGATSATSAQAPDWLGLPARLAASSQPRTER